MKKTAILFAGQGAQSVGMGRDLFDNFPVAKALFEKADAQLGRPLSKIIFEGTEEQITRTGNCQPALYLHGFALLSVLREKLPGFEFQAAAGLSLGEFTAHAAAGTFSFETGLHLVARRGEFMDIACDQTEGGMAALIGGDEERVRELAAQTDVDVANLNCPGQIVLSGEKAKIALAASLAREYGVRIAKILTVAGAYHSRLMDSAAQKLIGELAAAEIGHPEVPVICNVDARAVFELDEIRASLADQVTGSVLWGQSMQGLREEGFERFIELGPGKVLAGLMGRIDRDAEMISIGDMASLEAALPVLASE